MKLMKSVFAIAAALATAAGFAELSAPFFLDTRDGTRDARDVEPITYSSAWVTNAPSGAEAVVAVDGETLCAEAGEGEVAWSPTRVGTVTLTHKVMSGETQYGDTLTATFNVSAKDFACVQVDVDCSDVTYCGTAHTPAVRSVTWDGKSLTRDVDYTLAYSDNVEAGPATITLTGTNLYSGTYTTNFTILPKKMTATMVDAIASVAYTGAAHTPKPVVRDEERNVTLAEETDYTLSYTNNVSAGTAAVVVTGKGNYTGMAPRTFTIAPCDIDGATITLGDALTYNGQVQTQAVSGVSVDGLDVTFTVTGNTATDVGPYTLTVTGTGNFTGTATQAFSIAPRSIAGATVTLGDGLVYSGSPQSQGVSSVMIDGLDATFSVSDNSATVAGTYTLTVTGNGNFTGSATSPFAVSPKPLTPAMVGDAGTFTYEEGTAFTPKPAVTDAERGLALDEGTDYTLSYDNNALAGNATVTVTGMGNYAGTISKSFTIAKQAVEPPTIASSEYTGEQQQATVPPSSLYDVVQNAGGVGVGEYDVKLRLVDPSNYAWPDATGADLTLRFSDTKAANEWIAEPSISGWVYGQAPSQPDLGEAKFGSATVAYSAPPLDAGDYTATFTVMETANYTELTKVVPFTITSAEEEALKKAFEGLPVTIGPDGTGGWTVTVTNDIDSADLPVEIPDDVGHVTIDLYGHDLLGANGKDGGLGEQALPGGDGSPAIRIVPGAVGGGTTRLSLVTTGGDSLVKGGDGGAGNPGGNGAPAIQAVDGTQAGIKVDIGAGVTVQGGRGGADSPAVAGAGIGVNQGTLVKARVEVPEVPSAEYTGEEVAPQVPTSAVYAVSAPSEVRPGSYPVVLTLLDPVMYEWVPREGATLNGALAMVDFVIVGPPPQTRFHVTFDANGGEVDTTDGDYDIGTYYGVLPQPTRAGYVFDGWYESADFSGEPVTRNTEVIAQDVTLHAKWLRRKLWYTDAAFHLEGAATYDGYLIDGGDVVVGTIRVKAGKPNKRTGASKVTVTALLAGKKKITLKGSTFDGTFKGNADGMALELALGFSSLTGSFGRYVIDGTRNVFTAKDADSKLKAAQSLNRWQGTYVLAWRAERSETAPYNTLSLTIKAKGKMKVKGTLADGTKVSASSQLLMGERECAVAVSWTKKSASVACLVWLCADGSVECGNLPGGVPALVSNVRTGATLMQGAAFRIDPAAVSDVIANLQADLLPDGLEVRMKGMAFDIDKAGKVKLLKDKSGIDLAALGTNPSGLKLKYTAKDGTVKGVFSAYTLSGGTLKKVKVQVSGVVLGGRCYGTASLKKPAAAWPITIK